MKNEDEYWDQRGFIEEIINQIPAAIFWKDSQSVFLGCNQFFAELSGLTSPAEIVGKTDFDLPWKNEAKLYIKDDQEIMRSKKPKLGIEEPQTLSNGDVVILLTNKIPLISQKNKVVGILGIFHDITARKKIEDELRASKEAAEAANRAKITFIANMSHDIRTPLAGVIGLAEVLENSLQNREQKQNAHLLHDSGEQLLCMLNNILDDVQAERIDYELEHKCFNIHQTIKNLIRLESPATQLKGLQLNYYIADEVPRHIISDPIKIQRVLLNLLGNAIKFTDSGTITLTVECLNKDYKQIHLKFSVTDTGIGIPEEVQAEVFNRFFKVNSSYKGMYTGNGLGLHIVQSYVNLLGGHITLISTLGRGSTFHFDLECGISEEPKEVEAVRPVILDTMPHQSYHLLLIEDNLVALKSLEALLTARGYTFSSATSAEDALTMLASQSVDLIISDIGLPGLSGTEFALKVRTDEQASNKPPIPIIGLTGHAKETAEQECRNSGMNEVFSKPAPMNELDQCIQQLMLNKTPRSSKVEEKSPSVSPLGVDLPHTEAELFQLEKYSLFDEAYALIQIPDKNLLTSLITTYCSDDIQKDIQHMECAHQDTNWEQVEKLAHKFKGGVSYLGTQRMKFACQYLERYYKAGHRTLLEPLYQQLLRVNQETIDEVTHWLHNNQ